MFAFVPRRSVRIFTALCALSLAACGDDDDDVSHDHGAESTAGQGSGGKSGSAGSKAGSGGKAGSAGKATAGAGGKAAAGAGGKAAGAGGKAAAGTGGKAGAGGKAAAAGKGGAGGKAAGGTGGSKAGAGGAGGTAAGAGGETEVGGQGGSGSESGTATASLVGLAADGSLPAEGEDAGVVSTEHATATFTQTATGVTLKVELAGCDANQSYPIHIHAGSSCENVSTQGGHWDVPRGEGIPNVACGDDGTGVLEYTRENDDANGAWTVGGDENDVVGHVLVIHSPYDDQVQRAACGKIE